MQHYSLRERAYLLIKERILNLEYKPGSQLREETLAEEISMSRTPVREAINKLAAEGLVNSVPRKGIFTKEVDEKEIADLIEIREALEILSVTKCIQSATDASLISLASLLNQFEAALTKKRFKKLNALDSLFHLEIAKLSNNDKLISYLSEIEDFMRITRAIEKETDPETKNRQTLQEHRNIFQAIKSGNIENAQKAVIKNITSMKENLGITP